MAGDRPDTVPMATLDAPYVEENPFNHHHDHYDSDHDRRQAAQEAFHDKQYEVASSTSHDQPRSLAKGDYAPFEDQPREPIGIPYRGPLYHLKAWSPEAAWCFLTICVFISLVVVLAHHDGKRIPEWPLGLTINTVVALLATMCRFMTFIPVAEGISQLKWNWFTAKTRPLKDLYSFDQASRGPWGAIVLITRLRGRFISLGTMASFVMISGLVTSFLTQSAVSYSTRLIGDSHDGVIARAAQNYPYGMIDSGFDQQDVIDGISRAAFQAAFYTVDQSWPQVEPACPSADCSWPVFNSLAVCASLGNVTEHLIISEEDPEREWDERLFNATLPLNLGYVLEEWMDNKPRRHVNMTSPIVPQEADFPDLEPWSNMTIQEIDEDLDDLPSTFSAFPDERHTLYDWGNKDIILSTFSQFTFIYNIENTDPEDKDHRFRAVEVLWHFCVDRYNVSVSEGATKTEKVSSTVKIDEISKIPESMMNSFTLASDPDSGSKETFNISASWAYSRLDWDFRETLSGAWSDMYGVGRYTEFNYQWAKNLYRGVNGNMTAVETDDRMWKNLQNLTGTIADSMTSYMRNNQANGHVRGEFFTSETFVTVRWAWLAFLATQIGLTFVFLLIVVVHTARLDVEIVKSSNIAELFAMRGSETADNGTPVSMHPPRWMGFKPRLDSTMSGRLRKDGDHGWNLDLLRERERNSRLPPEG